MEKKNYEKPCMQVEAFVANQYCADCSDDDHSFVTYLFDCGNGLRDTRYYIRNKSNTGYATIDDKYYGPGWWTYYYEPCFEHHEVTVPKGHDVIAENADILDGYGLDPIGGDVDFIPVVLWTDGGTNMHATVKLDPHEWQTVKS